MKIRGKIFISVMSMALIFFVIIIGYLGFNFKKSTLIEAKKLTDSYALQSANYTKAKLENDMATVRTTAYILSDLDVFDWETAKKINNNALKRILKKNSHYLASWVSWELSSIKNNWIKPYGRERIAFVKENGKIKKLDDLLDLEGEKPESQYHKIKISDKTEFLLDPYLELYTAGGPKDSILETSLAVHIQKNNIYVGLVGIDIELSDLQSIVEKKIPFDNSELYLIANNGVYVSHPNSRFIGKNISDTYDERYSKINILENIKEGESFSFENVDENGKVIAYSSFVPVYIGGSENPWAIAVTVPLDVIVEKADQNFFYTILVGIIGFISMAILIFIISENITRPLSKTIKVLNKIDKGDISKEYKLNINRKDEIGEMSKSVNKLIDQLNITAEFASQLGKGEFHSEFKATSENDVLANALLTMHDDLKKAEIERKDRVEETQKRAWFQNGITEISDIIQQNYNDNEELAYNLIKKIVKYINANQGGLFFLEFDEEENQEILILKAAYAYDKRKQLKAKIRVGESIVGRCALEKFSIYIDNVPPGYTFISSGLGEENPNYLTFIPLLHEKNVYGVIEIASFNEIDQYQKDFLETISQRIASAVSNIKITSETSVLLEQLQSQASELEIKEKETAVATSKLEKAQKEIEEREAESKGIMEALIASASVIFYDMEGRVTDLNQKNEELLSMKKEEIIGKTHFELLEDAKKNPEWFKEFWDDLRAGRIRTKEFHLKTKTQEIWLSETFTPIIDNKGKPYKVINIGIDITAEKLLKNKK